MSPPAALRLSLAALRERLCDPAADAALATAAGVPLLEIDLGGAPPDRDVAALAERVRALPCPTIALGADAWPQPLRDRAFDVCAADDAEHAAVVASVTAAPLAALALAQLLRAGPFVDALAGLTVESLLYSALQAGPEFEAWRRAHPARPRALETRAPVEVERSGATLVVTLARPERRNALSRAMRDALCDALAVAAAEPTLRVVLRGHGPSFCSGGDLDEFGSRPDPATAHAVRTARSPARLLAACGRRTRAEVQGHCYGAGVELAAFAAEVQARADATFALPELRLGLAPGAGGTVSLPRRIGRERTAALALSGRAIDAETARAWGLVDRIGV